MQLTMWQEHKNKWGDCTKCELHKTRYKIVLGRGTVPNSICILGEAPGTSEDSEGKPFCLWEGHRVLMADLSWKPLGDIKVGDKIIAPDEYGEATDANSASKVLQRKWRIATVNTVFRNKKSCKRVVTEDGELIGTGEHKVLTGYKTKCKNSKWFTIDQLVPMTHNYTRASCITKVFNPWKTEDSYRTGWLAGFLDGEGYVTRTYAGKIWCGFSQNSGPVCEQAKKYLTELDFKWGVDSVVGKCEKIVIKGGLRETIRLLGTLRPTRLTPKVEKAIELKGPRVATLNASRVHNVSYYKGMTDVVDIQTTTGTFICEGYVVHNCGPAGFILNQIVDRSIPKNISYALTNMLGCIPVDKEGKKENELDDNCIATCSPRVEEFIKICDEGGGLKFIVTVGNYAKDWLDQRARNTRQKPHLLLHRKIPSVHINHPSWMLRRPIAQRSLDVQSAVVTIQNAIEEYITFPTNKVNIEEERVAELLDREYDEDSLPF